MMLNRVSLNTIGLNRIGLNRIGKPSRASSDRPYIDPEVLASLKAVCICYGKSNDDPDRAVVKNLVDPDNPFVISNAAYTEGSGYADKGSPYYGAFVTDGINDLITSTKTVQEMLGGSNEITVVSMIHQIELNSTYSKGFTNYIEKIDSITSYVRTQSNVAGKTGIYGYTFNSATQLPINNILGDKNDYEKSLANAANILSNSKFSVAGGINNTNTFSSVAWYWTIIANKVLTTDQINQVIAYFNLDKTLKPDILCNTIKQGITNENHAEFGDKLIDFSGNGRDIQLNNIAWKGDSGIGKYETDFTTWTRSHFTDEVNFTPSKIEVTGILTTNSILINNKPTPIYNVEMHSPNKSIVVYYQYNDDTGVKRIALVDGINELPSANDSLFVTSDRLNSKGITITQIPSHAGALCLDGVDDFGKVTGMPVYKDFTVIANRRFIGAHTGAVISKSYAGNSGAFYFESGSSVASFGLITSLAVKEDIDISYLSKYVYKGDDIQSGTAVDSDEMWLGILRDNDPLFSNIAIYSLMSFPYSMSEFLIERQLKKHKLGTLYPNMVEWRPIIKSNLPYSSITYSVNPGEYISVDSMVTITVTLPNTSDKLMEVSCNAISDISISGDNGVYEITGKVVKSPQKINLVISSYLTMLNNETLISNETLIKNE